MAKSDNKNKDKPEANKVTSSPSPKKAWSYNHRSSRMNKLFWGRTKPGLVYAFGAVNTSIGDQPFLVPFQNKVMKGTVDSNDQDFDTNCAKVCEDLNINATLPRRDRSKHGNVAITHSYVYKGEQKTVNRFCYIGDLSDVKDKVVASKNWAQKIVEEINTTQFNDKKLSFVLGKDVTQDPEGMSM